MLDEVDNATFVLEHHFLYLVGTFVAKDHFEALVQKGHGLQTLHDGAGNKLNTFSGKNDGVGIEGHTRTVGTPLGR